MRFNINTPVLRWLGRISYPLYLVHVPVHQVVVDLMPKLGEVATAALCIIAALILAVIMHGVVERPLVNVGKSVIARYASTRHKAKVGVV
jgi:peptidoglycan/LPS O-acetylase OafA/YrhL